MSDARAVDVVPVADAVLGRLRALVGDLRRARVPVGLTSVVDAANALACVDLGEREQVRHALRATLITRSEDLPLFDACFDARFARPPPPPAPPSGVPPSPLRDRLVDALSRDDTPALEALADEAVRRHAGFGTASGSSRYRLARTLRAIDAGGLAPDALRRRRAGGDRDRLAELVDRTDTAAALDRFLAALAGHIERQAAEDGGYGDRAPEPVRLEDVEIATASTAELRQLRRAVRPLARQLAARLARRRHRPRGALDVRRTIRRSIGSGGVPIDPAFRRRHPDRPDLWVLCDVSGSVAEHARFTIGLLSAIHDEVPRLRSFLFVDDLVEVTQVLAARRHDLDPFAVVAGAGAPLGGRQSDWGAVLARFRDQHARDLTPRSTVLLTGDGRSHDHDPRPDLVGRLAERARGLWLLDPEPPEQWTAGDSAVPAYRRAGMHVVEVRTLAQLADAVERILTTPGRRIQRP
jgi:uncharacterized protein with von Willebrand factor type A (vWA) domain